MSQKKAIVFGGSSGIGEAAAQALVAAGSDVTITGRDEAKLAAAQKRLAQVHAIACDATDSDAVARVFDSVGTVDDVVICVSGGKGAGLFVDLNLADLHGALKAKTLAQLTVAQVAAKRMKSGSITFVTAASPRSVIRGTAGLAAVNGALEALIPILALELAPVRVNAVSPGIIDTPWWEGMPEAAKASFFATAAATLPVRRVGSAAEVGEMIALLTRVGFVTGSIYEIDGGSHLVTQ